jgi:hypothetical protein
MVDNADSFISADRVGDSGLPDRPSVKQSIKEQVCRNLQEASWDSAEGHSVAVGLTVWLRVQWVKEA